VATKDVAPHALVAGVPARPIGWVCVCAATLKFAKGRARCAQCQRAFSLKKGAVAALDAAAGPAPRRASRPASRGR
jgi:UDP-2-acetamido-3-amino-2,3-dideoxy-glucuronate N-acetyltransferase